MEDKTVTQRGVAKQFGIPQTTFRENLNKLPDPSTGMVMVGHSNEHKMQLCHSEEQV